MRARADAVRAAIVHVGQGSARGRGFVIAGRLQPLVVTAAHCLPNLPPPHALSYTSERTFRDLLGPLGAARGTVGAECVFADPVADIAVLGSPDNQVLSDEADAYAELVEAVTPLRIASPMFNRPASVLSLDDRWLRLTLIKSLGRLRFQGVEVASGMSGSPIVQDGAAVGVVSVDFLGPRLVHDLPARILVAARRARGTR